MKIFLIFIVLFLTVSCNSKEYDEWRENHIWYTIQLEKCTGKLDTVLIEKPGYFVEPYLSTYKVAIPSFHFGWHKYNNICDFRILHINKVKRSERKSF